MYFIYSSPFGGSFPVYRGENSAVIAACFSGVQTHVCICIRMTWDTDLGKGNEISVVFLSFYLIYCCFNILFGF